MAISMYQASVPAFLQILSALTKILDKAIAHAAAKKIDQADLLNARLAPDMFNLTRQFQVAADSAKGATARLAGMDPPKFEDNEKTFEELKARLGKTIDFIKSIKPEQIDGSEDRDITFPIQGKPMTFKGQPYLVNFVFPNFYFHAATAYDILRHSGVELGKRDFLNAN